MGRMQMNLLVTLHPLYVTNRVISVDYLSHNYICKGLSILEKNYLMRKTGQVVVSIF